MRTRALPLHFRPRLRNCARKDVSTTIHTGCIRVNRARERPSDLGSYDFPTGARAMGQILDSSTIKWLFRDFADILGWISVLYKVFSSVFFFSFFMVLLVLFLLSWETFNSEHSFPAICDYFEISLISSGRFWFFRSIVLYNIYKISVAILEYFWHSYTFHKLLIIGNFIILSISPNIFRFFLSGISHWYFSPFPFYEVFKYECGFITL